MSKSYVPERGDIVWLQFSPQSGHEQAGQRPAITLSPLSYNKKVGLGLFCPITSKEKGYPFEAGVSLKKIQGVVLSDQLKSLDWKQRRVKFICKATPIVVAETVSKFLTLLPNIDS